MNFRGVLSLVPVLLLSVSLFSEEKPWTELRSPHFRLITNGSDADGRQLILHFELIRAVFEAQFPGFKLDAPAPLLILAPKDESTAKQLLPQMWAHPGPKVAGLYHHGWEREYALVRLDQVLDDRVNPDTYSVVYHEYVHSLLHINFRWIPSWLDEGLAEFYAYTRFEKDRMYIGAPPKTAAKIGVLDSKSSIPLARFVGSSMYSRDSQQTALSYAQAWALTHFLTFGPSMQSGQRLRQFFNSLQHGIEQTKAFQEAFGKFDDVQKQYDNYIQKFTFTTGVLPVPPHLDPAGFVARIMSLPETQAELAAWHIRFHQWDEVRTLTTAALQGDTKLPLAHEDDGFMLFNEGKDGEASKEFSEAVALDNKNYVTLFASVMTSPAATTNNPRGEQELHEVLNKVVELKPDYAPAYVELAKLAVRQGRLESALGLSQKAERLEPFRSGYHVLTGEILLRMNRLADAAAESSYVAQRWGGSDRDEAMELWERIPVASRPSDGPMPVELNEKWRTAQGLVKSVTCSGSAYAMTLDINGKPQTFKSTGFPVGFSDTLWVGRDHFSPCVHVQGLRAMVRYNPPKDETYAGDLVYGGFRDDLDPPKDAIASTGLH